MKRSRYSVKKVYIVICQDCNEDTGRTVQGYDPETRKDANELMRDHEEVFHGA